MAAKLHLVIIAVLSVFGVFMAALGYAQWTTRGVAVFRAKR